MRLLPVLLLVVASQIHAFRQDTNGLRDYISEANHCLSDLRSRLNLTKPATRTLLGIVGVGYDDLLARSTLPAPAEIAVHWGEAAALTGRIAETLGHIGVLTCEFFATDDGPVGMTPTLDAAFSVSFSYTETRAGTSLPF